MLHLLYSHHSPHRQHLRLLPQIAQPHSKTGGLPNAPAAHRTRLVRPEDTGVLPATAATPSAGDGPEAGRGAGAHPTRRFAARGRVRVAGMRGITTCGGSSISDTTAKKMPRNDRVSERVCVGGECNGIATNLRLMFCTALLMATRHGCH